MTGLSLYRLCFFRVSALTIAIEPIRIVETPPKKTKPKPCEAGVVMKYC